MKLPDAVVRNQEHERLNSQLEKATRVTFAVLGEAQERTDLDLVLACVDRLVALIDVRLKAANTFVPEQVESPEEDGSG